MPKSPLTGSRGSFRAKLLIYIFPIKAIIKGSGFKISGFVTGSYNTIFLDEVCRQKHKNRRVKESKRTSLYGKP
jgi:hypothetical protein